MALPPDASAAAAVAGLFLAATFASPLNFKLTGSGFHLYIPLGISTAFRGLAHAARASFLVGHNTNLMAVYGAFNAAGFGIAVAMCCCFLVIWLRNAVHSHTQATAKALSLTGRLLVATVIAFGPVLGVVGAIVMYAPPHTLEAQGHAVNIRQASASGFTAVSATALLISTYLAASWLLDSRRAAAAAAALPHKPTPATLDPSAHEDEQQQQQQQPQPHPHNKRHDGLITLLPACLLLLTWCSATRLASFYHPALLSSTVLYYTVSVLPELIVAYVFALRTLAARIALGGRYAAWRAKQQQRQQHKHGGRAGGGVGVSGSSNGSLASDAEVGVGEASAGGGVGKGVR